MGAEVRYIHIHIDYGSYWLCRLTNIIGIIIMSLQGKAVIWSPYRCEFSITYTDTEIVKYLAMKAEQFAQILDCLVVLTALYPPYQLLLCQRDRMDHCHKAHLLVLPSPDQKIA